MSLIIDIEAELPVPAHAEQLLEQAVRQTLLQEGLEIGSVAILLTGDARLRTLNKQFRGMDQATDVLSFPGDDPFNEGVGIQPHLGDIALAVPYAARQAAVAGHTLLEELQLLVVHGTLHLLGFDHSDADEKRAMWSMQEQVLAQLGLAHVQPTE